MSGCLPLLIQMPIIFALYNIIYAPLKYILRFSDATVSAAQKVITENPDVFKTILANKNYDRRPELYILQAVDKSPELFKDIGSDFVNKVSNFDFSFFGINLGDTPTFALNLLILIPILSFLSNFLFTMYTQKKSKMNNPAAKQMGMGMNAVMYIMPIFSAVFTFQFPAGVGLYWIFSSLFSLFQSMLLYKIYTPEKMAVFAEKSKANAKNKKPSLYQRAMDAQKSQQSLQSGEQSISSNDENDVSEEKLSKSAVKDLQRQRLNEARKRMAEKYGDTYEE